MSIQKVTGISKERRERAFGEALTYEQFIATAQVNVDRLQDNYDHYALSEQELAYFAGLAEPVHVLVLAHDWCGDVVANLPLFAKIEQVTGKLKLHILLRDPDNQDIAAAYLQEDGKNHIPTYVFFDEAGEELGVFIERPDVITARIRDWKDEFWEQHPQWQGRDLSLAELDEDVRQAFLNYLKEQRPKERNQEQTAIIEFLRTILN
ncbi:hypothetical protein BC351_19335 [Paenibacillus ferrarius]|uniref:Thioredoxin n=1 Tax=Paenibacillus ferrarius TaxID=1469647 RepID=A0A1V4HNU2_9BACL|nr:thioredoxin family protein [Paenibacillus ferrarius]OPH59637.1 hypothetical protein BC351_19335 [Paenibacillus ferrarius]